MNMMQQIVRWLGLDVGHPVNPQTAAVREFLEQGKRLKRSEDYDQALVQLDQARQQAMNLDDIMALAVIDLHRADVLIGQRKWADAEAVLREVQSRANSQHQDSQLAYILSAQGALAQAQNQWDTARQLYEQALKMARQSGTLGGEGRAMGHLADTYLHDHNASYAVHLLRDALPKLHTSGDIELSSYFVGLLGEAQIASGQDGEGDQLLNRALRLAEQMHSKMYERRWRIALGRRAVALGRYVDAYTHYERVLQLMGPATSRDEHITALCEICKVSMTLNHSEEALLYAREAAHLLSANPAPSPQQTALVEGAFGVTLRSAGHGSDAIPHLETAIEAYRQIENAEAQIDLLRNLAAAQADSGQTDAAIATYQQALQLSEKRQASRDLAVTYRDLGLLYANQGRMTDAVQQWSSAMTIYEANKDHAQIARLYCDLGSARKYLGQGQRSIKDFEQALMALNSVDDPETRGVVLSNAATAYADQGDTDTTDAFFSETIKIAQQSQDQRAEATRRGNYGWFLLSTGRLQRAEATLSSALRLSRELGLKLQIAVHTDNLGLVYDELNDRSTALEFHRQAFELVRPLNSPHWQAVIETNFANTQVASGQFDSAAPLYEEALTIGRTRSDIDITIRALTGQARLAIKREQPAAAETALTEAITLARRADMRRLLADALAVRSEQQAALNQPDQSAATWNEAHKLFAMLHATRAQFQPPWLNNNHH